MMQSFGYLDDRALTGGHGGVRYLSEATPHSARCSRHHWLRVRILRQHDEGTRPNKRAYKCRDTIYEQVIGGEDLACPLKLNDKGRARVFLWL